MSYPKPCRGCGTEIRLVVKNPVGGLPEPDHDEADCLQAELETAQKKLDRASEHVLSAWQATRENDMWQALGRAMDELYGPHMETTTEIAEWNESERDRVIAAVSGEPSGEAKRPARICEECEHPVDSDLHIQHCPEAIRG